MSLIVQHFDSRSWLRNLTDSSGQEASWQSRLCIILLLLFVSALQIMLAFGLVVPEAMQVATALFFVIPLVLFLAFDAKRQTLQSSFLLYWSRIFSTLVCAHGAQLVLSLLFSADDYWTWDRLDHPSRYFLIVPPFLLICRIRLSVKWIMFAIFVGGCSCGILGGYQYFIKGINGVSGASAHRILFGSLSALLGVFSLGRLLLEGIHWRNGYFIFSFLGSGLAVLTSGSRGALLSFVVLVFLAFVIWSIAYVRWRIFVVGIVITFGILHSLYQADVMGAKNGLVTALDGVEQFYEGDNTISSVGARLEMWSAARILFSESPILGKGPRTFRSESQRLISEGVVRSFGGHYAHAHNQYLEALATTGILGLVGVVGLLWIPLGFFVRYLFDSDLDVKTFSMVGIVLCAGYSLFGLTEAIFDRHMAIVFYLVLLSVCFGQIVQRISARGQFFPYRSLREAIMGQGVFGFVFALFVIFVLIYMVSVGVRPLSEASAVLAYQTVIPELSAASLFLKLGLWVQGYVGYSLSMLRFLGVFCFFVGVALLVVSCVSFARCVQKTDGKDPALSPVSNFQFTFRLMVIALVIVMISPRVLNVVYEYQPDVFFMVLGFAACLALMQFRRTGTSLWLWGATVIFAFLPWVEVRGWAYVLAGMAVLVVWRYYFSVVVLVAAVYCSNLFYGMNTNQLEFWGGLSRWWPGFGPPKLRSGETLSVIFHSMAYLSLIVLLCWVARREFVTVCRAALRPAALPVTACKFQGEPEGQWLIGSVLLFTSILCLCLLLVAGWHVDSLVLLAPLWAFLTVLLWLRIEAHKQICRGFSVCLLVCACFQAGAGVRVWHAYEPEARLWQDMMAKMKVNEGVLIAPISLVANELPESHFVRFQMLNQLMKQEHLSLHAALQKVYAAEAFHSGILRVVTEAEQEAVLREALELAPFQVIESYHLGRYRGFLVRVTH